MSESTKHETAGFDAGRTDVQIDREQGHEDVVSLLRAAARHPYKGPNDTDASMLQAAAARLRGGYQPGGSWTQQTVARVCELVASLIEDARPVEDPVSFRQATEGAHTSVKPPAVSDAS